MSASYIAVPIVFPDTLPRYRLLNKAEEVRNSSKDTIGSTDAANVTRLEIDKIASDLRRAPRTPVLGDVKILPNSGPCAGRSTPGIVHDISATGVGLSCALRLTPGGSFDLLIRHAGQRCRVTCRVVHSYLVTEGWWAIGAAFESLEGLACSLDVETPSAEP